MAYTINKYDGTVLTQISDGALDTSTCLSLPGPNYVGYGRSLNENLVYLLENFAGNSAPTGRNLPGQLYYDTYSQKLKVFSSQPGVGYISVSGITTSGLTPENPKDGDIWFNTGLDQTFIYDNGRFKLIGPNYTKAQGPSGAFPATVDDGGFVGITHNIVKITYGNTIIATLSTVPSFIPGNFDPGFPFINPGITLNSNIANPSMNTNVVGNLTGSVVGNLTGNVLATLVQTDSLNANSVFSTQITGTLTGATFGTHTGNVNSTAITATNFSTGNALITGGNFTGTNATVNNNLFANNFSSPNVLINNGTATLTNLTATNALITNFSTGNAVIRGGYISALANITATNATIQNSSVTNETVTNFSSGNVLITGGNISVTNATINTGSASLLTVANAQIQSGDITVGNATVTNATLTNLNSSNVLITGGNVSGVTGYNDTFVGANLYSSTTNTVNVSVKTTALATTQYVHNLLPTGTVVMFNGNTIPYGWRICDGTNGTPDLRDKFVVGAGLSYFVGSKGGNDSLTLTTAQIPTHVHGVSFSSVTASAGAHTHGISVSVTDSGHSHTFKDFYNGTGGTGPTARTPTTYYVNDLIPYTTQTTDVATTGISASATASSVPDHNHNFSISGNTAATGGSGPSALIDIRPNYYALYYIIKWI